MKIKLGDTVEVVEEGASEFGRRGRVCHVNLAPNNITVWISVEFPDKILPRMYQESCLKWIKPDADYVQEWLR